jgi:hypothetical protein
MFKNHANADQGSIAGDVGKLYKKISSELVNALLLFRNKQTAPDKTYVKISFIGCNHDKSDIQKKIDKILTVISCFFTGFRHK